MLERIRGAGEVRVNGELISPEHPVSLHNDDRIRIGVHHYYILRNPCEQEYVSLSVALRQQTLCTSIPDGRAGA